jgi:hypothetical protein
MSIDLFCYSTATPSEAEQLLARVISQHSDLFTNVMSASTPRAASAVHEEIASEHGLDASSLFSITVRDKSQASRIHEVASILREAFDTTNRRVLVLRDNENPI